MARWAAQPTTLAPTTVAPTELWCTSAQVGNWGETASRPLAVLSLLIAASRMARYCLPPPSSCLQDPSSRLPMPASGEQRRCIFLGGNSQYVHILHAVLKLRFELSEKVVKAPIIVTMTMSLYQVDSWSNL